MAYELEVPAQSSFLIVDERLEWAQVEDRQRLPVLGNHSADQGKECGLGLAARRLRLNDDILTVKNRANARLLHLTQSGPADAVDDVVLKRGVESVEAHFASVSNAMSSTPEMAARSWVDSSDDSKVSS